MRIKKTFFIVSCIICHLAYAQDDVEFPMKYDGKTKSLIPLFLGKVLKIRGKVWYRPKDGDKIPVNKESKFNQSDTIQTGPRSYLKIKIVDDTIMDLGGKTRFQFASYRFKTKEKRAAIYNILSGKIRSNIRTKAEKNAIRFRMGRVSMGVRGTQVLMNFVPESDGSMERAHALVISGRMQANLDDPEMDEEKGVILNRGTLMDSKVFKEVKENKMTFIDLTESELNTVSGNNLDPEVDEFPFIPETLLKREKEKFMQSSKKEEKGDEAREKEALLPPPKRKNWKQLLKDQQTSLSEKNPYWHGLAEKEEEKRRLKGVKRVKLPPCEFKKECIEFEFYTVRGKRFSRCKKEVYVKTTPNCIGNPPKNKTGKSL